MFLQGSLSALITCKEFNLVDCLGLMGPEQLRTSEQLGGGNNNHNNNNNNNDHNK